jgi:hypothetical protein
LGDTKSPSPLKGLRTEGVCSTRNQRRYAVKTDKESNQSQCYQHWLFALLGLNLFVQCPISARQQGLVGGDGRLNRPQEGVSGGSDHPQYMKFSRKGLGLLKALD